MEKQDNDKVTVVLSKRLCKVLQAYAWHAGDCEDIGACYTLSSLFRKLATVDSVTLDDPDFDKVKLTGGCLEDDFPYICSDSAHEVEAEIEAIKDKI